MSLYYVCHGSLNFELHFEKSSDFFYVRQLIGNSIQKYHQYYIHRQSTSVETTIHKHTLNFEWKILNFQLEINA